MNIKDYRKKRLKWYNRAINFILWIVMSFVIISIISIGMMEATINHFEMRSDAVTDKVTTTVIEFAEDYIAQEIGDTIPEDQLEIHIGNVSQQLKPKIQGEYDKRITEGKAFLNNLKQDNPFMGLVYLNLMFFFLLILFFVNNDLVLTVNYLSRKLVLLVPALFVLPYLLFKSNLLAKFAGIVGSLYFIQMPIPVDPKAIFAKALELVSGELALFYSKFLPYALVAMFAGLVLWFGNRFYILPFFAKKHGYVEGKEEKTEEKEEKKETKKKTSEKTKKKPKKKIKKKAKK
ncbi:MAG: hypothetical protein ABH828_06450 [archaeon]